MIVHKFKEKENDPYLNEIWDMGYNEAYMCEMSNTLTLVNSSNRAEKDLRLNDFKRLIQTLKIITGYTQWGDCHQWVSEADGSAQRLRDFVNSSITIKVHQNP